MFQLFTRTIPKDRVNKRAKLEKSPRTTCLNLVPDDPEDVDGWEPIDIFKTYADAENVLSVEQNPTEEAKIIPVIGLEANVEDLESARKKKGKEFDELVWLETVFSEAEMSEMYEEIIQIGDETYICAETYKTEQADVSVFEPDIIIGMMSKPQIYEIKYKIGTNCDGPSFYQLNIA